MLESAFQELVTASRIAILIYIDLTPRLKAIMADALIESSLLGGTYHLLFTSSSLSTTSLLLSISWMAEGYFSLECNDEEHKIQILYSR